MRIIARMSTVSFRIDWQETPPVFWRDCMRLPLTQDPLYGRIAAAMQQQRCLYALCKNEEGAAIGYAQFQEAALIGRALHGLILDRGPVWLSGEGNAVRQKAFWQALARRFPRRIGRRRRIIPELEAAHEPDIDLAALGFRRRPYPGYETFWLDLEGGEAVWRKRLQKNWRGSLKKAEQSADKTVWSAPEAALPLFLAAYEADKGARGYRGASPRLLAQLAKAYAAEGRLMIGSFGEGANSVGAVMILCHGRSATYQAGWTTQAGRQAHAHHLLLWQALPILREKGILELDLGGVRQDEDKSLFRFKRGLGGVHTKLAGMYG